MIDTTDPDSDGSDSSATGDEIRAAEFVIGLVDARQRDALKERSARDPDFARRVIAWERRFAPWLVRFAPLKAPAGLWDGIQRQLDRTEQRVDRPTVRYWERVQPWRWAAAAAIAFAAIMSFEAWKPRTPVVIVQQPTTPVVEEEVAKPVAVLRHDDGSVGWLVSIDTTKGALLMVPVPAPAASDGRVDELWISNGHDRPQSLGFVSNEKAHTIVVPASLRQAVAGGAQLSISLEDKPGIPHSTRSARVIASGVLQGI